MDEEIIKVLLSVKSHLEDTIQERKREIELIVSKLAEIDSLISNQTFKSADKLIQTNDTESFIKSHKKLQIDNVENTRKIYSNSKDLQAHLSFNSNTIEIQFPHPELINLNQEKYIEIMVKGIFLKIKEQEPKIKVDITKNFLNNENYIKTIILANIFEYESFEFIYTQIRDFIQKQK